MQIEIKNTITIDDQVELIREVYDCELGDKAGWLYLIYQNGEKEKVVIKIKADEMVMTRFSNPQSLMRFVKNGRSSAQIPTPMGVQKLVTDCQRFILLADEKHLTITYDLLLSPDHDQELANYQLELSWGENLT